MCAITKTADKMLRKFFLSIVLVSAATAQIKIEYKCGETTQLTEKICQNQTEALKRECNNGEFLEYLSLNDNISTNIQLINTEQNIIENLQGTTLTPSQIAKKFHGFIAKPAEGWAWMPNCGKGFTAILKKPTECAPYECKFCNIPNVVPPAYNDEEAQIYENRTYNISCPQTSVNYTQASCSAGKWKLTPEQAQVPATSKEECNRFQICPQNQYRNGLVCMKCPHTTNDEPLGFSFKDACSCKNGFEHGERECMLCEPGKYQNETGLQKSCRVCAGMEHDTTYGRESCQDKCTEIKFEGQCIKKPTTLAEIQALIDFQVLTWRGAARQDYALTQTTPQNFSYRVEDFILDPAPQCNFDEIVSAVHGRCEPCPGNTIATLQPTHRDPAAKCAPVRCDPYGTQNLTTKRCENDTALLEILAQNVSEFCYPVGTPTTCRRCRSMTQRQGYVNTLQPQEVQKLEHEVGPCKYTCAAGFEPKALLGLGQGWVVVSAVPSFATRLVDANLEQELAKNASADQAMIWSLDHFPEHTKAKISSVQWTNYVQTASGTLWRPVGFGCVPCLPGFFKALDGDDACIPCAAGKYSSDFMQSTSCLDCPAHTYSRGHGQHVCLPCYDNANGIALNQTWHVVPRAEISSMTNTSNLAFAEADLLRYKLDVGAWPVQPPGQVVDVHGVLFRADEALPCDPSRDFLLEQAAACGGSGTTQPNCAPCPTLSGSDTEFQTECLPACPTLRFANGSKVPGWYCRTQNPNEKCGDGFYADDEYVCRACAEHTCSASDEFLQPDTCPPKCTSCLEFLQDGEILADSPQSQTSCAKSNMCARGYVVRKSVPVHLQNLLEATKKCIPVRGTNILETTQDGVQCEREDTEELDVHLDGTLYCKTRPNPCKSPHAVRYNGVCQCLPDFYGSDLDPETSEPRACHLCALHRIAPRGSVSVQACVCREGYLDSGDGDTCEACPRGAKFYCPGNNSVAPCPENTTTQSTTAFSQQHCEPDASFERNVATGDIQSCDTSLEGSALSTFVSGCSRICAVGSMLTADGCRCRTRDGFEFHTETQQCQCRAGLFRAEDACVLCTRGAFCPGPPLQKRELCTDILASTQPGATSAENCTCPPGFYQDSATRQCRPCPVKSICSENQRVECEISIGNGVQFFCSTRRLSTPLICPRGAIIQANEESDYICKNVDDPELDQVIEQTTKFKLLLGIAKYDEKRGNFLGMLYEDLLELETFQFYLALMKPDVEQNREDYLDRLKWSGLNEHITIVGTLHSRCLQGQGLVLGNDDRIDLFMQGNGSVRCAEIVPQAHAGLLGPMQYPSPGTVPLGPSGRGDPVRLPEANSGVNLRDPKSHLLWTPLTDCTGAAFLPVCCAQHDNMLQFEHSVRERIAGDVPGLAYVPFDAPTQHVWGQEKMPFLQNDEPCPPDSLQDFALALLLRESDSPTRTSLNIAMQIDASTCVQVGPVAYRPGTWVEDRVHLLDRGLADLGGDAAPALSSSPELHALLVQRRALTMQEIKTYAPGLAEGGTIYDTEYQRYYVRRTEKRVLVPREAIALLEPKTGRLAWELYARGGALVRRIVAPHISGTSIAFAVALPTWSFATTPELLPALVAGVCNEKDLLRVVFCSPVGEDTCRVAQTLDVEAGPVCAARMNGAAFVDLYRNKILLDIPGMQRFEIDLTDFRATPTHTPTLHIHRLQNAPGYRSVFVQPLWDAYNTEIMGRFCEFVLMPSTNSAEITLSSGPYWANASKAQIAHNISAALLQRHHRMLPAGAVQTLECVDMALRDSGAVKLTCNSRVAVLLLCRIDKESREWMVLGGEADFSMQILDNVGLLGTRVLPPFVDGMPRIALRAEPVAANDTFINVLHTRVRVELLYITVGPHVIVHREVFAASCRKNDDIISQQDSCPTGQVRVCVPCDNIYCEQQDLTWNATASRCLVPAIKEKVTRFAVRCIPCTGSAACPNDLSVEPCEQHAFAHENDARSNLSCSCPVNQTFVPSEVLVFGEPRAVTIKRGNDQCRNCDVDEICHPLLLNTAKRCPPRTTLQFSTESSQRNIVQYNFKCACDVPRARTGSSIENYVPGDQTPLEIRQWDWSHYPGLFGNARYKVEVEVCKHMPREISFGCKKGEYGILGNCEECPKNFYCPLDKIGPVPCPRNMHTAKTRMASEQDCMCQDGLYKEGDACVACPAGYFCRDDAKTACEGNVSASLNRSQCMCEEIGKTWNDTKKECQASGTKCAEGEIQNQDKNLLQNIKNISALFERILDNHPFATADLAVLKHWNLTSSTRACVKELRGMKLQTIDLNLTAGYGFGLFDTTKLSCPVAQNESRIVLSLAACAQTATQWSVRGELNNLLRFAWPGIVLIDARERLSPTLSRAMRDIASTAAELHFAMEPQPVVQALSTRGLFVIYGNIDMLRDSYSGKPQTVLEAVLQPALAWYRAVARDFAADPSVQPIVVAGSFLHSPAMLAAAHGVMHRWQANDVPIFLAAEAESLQTSAHIWHARRRNDDALLLVSPVLLETAPVGQMNSNTIVAVLPRLILERDYTATCPPGLTVAEPGTCTRCARGDLRMHCDRCGQFLDTDSCPGDENFVGCTFDNDILCSK